MTSPGFGRRGSLVGGYFVDRVCGACSDVSQERTVRGATGAVSQGSVGDLALPSRELREDPVRRSTPPGARAENPRALGSLGLAQAVDHLPKPIQKQSGTRIQAADHHQPRGRRQDRANPQVRPETRQCRNHLPGVSHPELGRPLAGSASREDRYAIVQNDGPVSVPPAL